MADVQAQVTGTAGTLALAFLALLAFLGQGWFCASMRHEAAMITSLIALLLNLSRAFRRARISPLAF